MIQQLTALILSCLMLVVSATSQVGLRFCLCEKTMFMSECPCEEAPNVDVASSCSCSESCDDPVTETEYPCDDCDLTIVLEFDECVPQWGSDFKVSSEILDLPFQSFVLSEILSPKANEILLLEVSRGPPPGLLRASTPLYLRHSVFLI